MPSSWTQNYYHLVFSTKGRDPSIGLDLRDRMYPFAGGIVRDLNSSLIVIGGMPDHVHLLIRFAADVAPATLAREVKARSSRWVHEVLPAAGGFAWQRGYGGFTVSKSAVPSVEEYIRTQEAHHGTMSFKDEFLLLLEKHGIEYDPRYVFD